MLDAVAHRDRRCKAPVLYVEVGHRGVVSDLDAERLCGAVIGVEQGLAAAKKERVDPSLRRAIEELDTAIGEEIVLFRT